MLNFNQWLIFSMCRALLGCAHSSSLALLCLSRSWQSICKCLHVHKLPTLQASAWSRKFFCPCIHT
uniref:Secreted protein n=1 Tax=Aegilops tauschii subsp. strangulata TaxID=200361 RepID=A0A452XZ74_AEGTS